MAILLGLALLFGIIAVPIAAFVALSRSAQQKLELAALRQAVGALRIELDAVQLGLAPERATEGAATPAVSSKEPVAESAEMAPVVPAVLAPTIPAAAIAAAPLQPAVGAEPSKLAPAPAPRVALEERLGARVFVWIGGVALALAGAFLVKYSIDAGLLGPGVRVALGLLLGLLLLAGGEFMHARSTRIAQALSAAGPACLFASLFAAVSLYDLVAPSVGFLLLAAVTIGTVALSLRQGPFVGLVGLAGGFLTPAIVGSDEPRAGVLFAYLFLLQVGTQILTRRRAWWWLATVAVGGGMLWVAVWLMATSLAPLPIDQRIWPLLFLAGSALAAAWTILRPTLSHRQPAYAGAHYTALGTLAGVAILLAADVAAQGYALPEWIVFGMASAFMLVMARVRPSVEPVAALIAGLAVLVLATWQEPFDAAGSGSFVARFSAIITVMGALFAIGGFVGLWGAAHKLRWAVFSALASVSFFLVAYGRLRTHGGLPSWGFVSLALAALYLIAAERVARHRATATDYREALGVFALGVTGFVALAVPLELEHAWMAVAWSLQLPAVAWVERRLDIPWLRHAAWVFGGLVMLRLFPVPLVFEMPLGDTPVFNWILYGYGLPLLGFVAAAILFRARADDRLVTALEVGAAVIGFMLVSLEIRHGFHGADLTADAMGLGEIAGLLMAWLLAGIALLLAGDWWRRPALLWSGHVLLAISALAMVAGPLLLANPLLVHLPVGQVPIANVLLVAYAVPGLLALALARLFERRGEPRLALAAGCIAIMLGFVWASLAVRQWFQGEFLDQGPWGDAETYAYSAVWLAYGILLLVGGVATRGRALRYASLAVIVVAVCKVFLLDAAALTGLYRVASFLGLGLTLLAIGYAYQRFVLSGEQARAAPA